MENLEYEPKHKGEYKPEKQMCTVCGKYPLFSPGSPALGGALCIVCSYDL